MTSGKGLLTLGWAAVPLMGDEPQAKEDVRRTKSAMTFRIFSIDPPSERLEIFLQVALLLDCESQGAPQDIQSIVMIDHVTKRREAAVVIEAARCVRPESLQRSGSITSVGSAARLKVVDADLGAGMHIPTGLGEE